MTFDMQSRHVIDIPRDLFLQSRWKSTTVQFFFIYYIFWRSTINPRSTISFRNSKKYDISLYLSHMMVDRSSCCYFWGSDFCFCSEIIFVTKYRVQSRVICGFFICCIRCFSGRRRKCEILSLIESLSFTYTVNVIFKLKISKSRKWADKNSSETLLRVNNCLKLLIYV